MSFGSNYFLYWNQLHRLSEFRNLTDQMNHLFIQKNEALWLYEPHHHHHHHHPAAQVCRTVTASPVSHFKTQLRTQMLTSGWLCGVWLQPEVNKSNRVLFLHPIVDAELQKQTKSSILWPDQLGGWVHLHKSVFHHRYNSETFPTGKQVLLCWEGLVIKLHSCRPVSRGAGCKEELTLPKVNYLIDNSIIHIHL